MADIDSIIAGTGGNTRADFSNLFSAGFDSFFKGRDEKAKNDLRDAFKPTAQNPSGVPLTPDGQLDLPAMVKTLYQKGGIDQGNALISAAIGPTERAKLDTVDSPSQAQPAIVSPPSANRSATVTVAQPLNKGGTTPQGGGSPQGGGTLMQVISAQMPDLPNDQLGAATASVARQLGLSDPNAPIDLQDPQVRNVLVPAIQQLKRMGIGQVQPPQPGDNPPQAPQPQPVAQPQPLQASPQQQAAQNDPILKRLTLLAASPDKATAAAAQTRLKSYLAGKEPTPEMKNAAASGLSLPDYQERQGELAAQQAGATEQAKSYVEKYNTINAAGDQAINEIPKLKLALKQMDDPNYYSGPFNQYNVNAKRLVAALGGDPDKAAPQEIVNKITADSVLNGMGALKGLGPIRVAEMKLLSQATLSPDNSIQAQKFLASMAIRVQERVAKVSDIAQDYNGGVLDNGFDKKIRAEDRANPLFSQAEIDRFQKIMAGKEKQTNQPTGGVPKFSSPNDVHAAVSAGTLKRGDRFTDPNGVVRVVP